MAKYSLDQKKTTLEIDDVEQPFVDFAKSRGWICEKVVSLSRKGWPDRFLARKGHIVLCEFKAPLKVPGEQQLKRHKELRAAGIEVVWFNDLEKAKEYFW